MTPSERINQIKDISEVLSKEDYSIVNLTLEQFGLPTQYWEDFDAVPYVVAMLRNVSDESLLELSKHLGTASELESIDPPSFWESNQPRIFISHLSKIKDTTISIKEELEKYSIAAFVAHSDIEPTKEWQSEIEIALSTMDALVALLSPGFKESNWTDQEVGVAIGRAVPIVPVRMDLDPYGFIGKFQGLQGKGKDDQTIAREIVKIFITKPSIEPKITSGIVEKFINSGSYANAKRNMGNLELCRHLTPDMVQKLNEAATKNSQIRDVRAVTIRLRQLIKEIGT